MTLLSLPQGAMLIEVDYYLDGFGDDCVTFIFAHIDGKLEFVGAFYELLRDDEQGRRVSVPCDLSTLPDDALSAMLANAWIVCDKFGDEPATLRDPSKWEA